MRQRVVGGSELSTVSEALYNLQWRSSLMLLGPSRHQRLEKAGMC